MWLKTSVLSAYFYSSFLSEYIYIRAYNVIIRSRSQYETYVAPLTIAYWTAAHNSNNML